jgi:hypothetical protein
MFLCTIPAGALADMVEPRRFLIALETLVVILMGLLGAVIFFHGLTPAYLLSDDRRRSAHDRWTRDRPHPL